jgi:hypothetical protein
MQIQLAVGRFHAFISCSRLIALQLKRCLSLVTVALILTFAGITQAVALEVGLVIENSMDSNGNIVVVNGSKVKVIYEVDDPDKVSGKKDKIQLLRVSDGSVVSSVARGKKKSGAVSLKVKNSEGEQLYVGYVLKGETEPAATASHPDDEGFIPLLSVANMSLEDLIISNAALQAQPRANVANRAPNVNDDIDLGYPAGSVWVDMSQNQAYILVDGTAGAAVWKHVTDHAETYAIGDTGPAGGVVFYITDGGAHGLEAAAADLTAAEWGCFKVAMTGADGVAVGTGAQNTADVLAGCATPGIAAQLASAYSLNGYTDWFLPSKDALNELYKNKAVIGGFVSNYYWSSSEFNNLNAWYQGFSDGFKAHGNKNSVAGGRAVRAF